MQSYTIRQSPKTKLLNTLRRIFIIPVVEKALVRILLKHRHPFLLKLIPPDYLYRLGNTRRVARMGINYELDISHVVDHAIYYGFSEPGFDIIRDVLKKAAVIVDIGANIGAVSLYFASINNGARILAFEPHPGTFARARKNLELNDCSNIELINLGLGASKETVRLYEVNEHNPGMNRILATASDKPFVEIEINTLDSVLAGLHIQRVGCIKIDVEGYELAVLRGAQNTLQSKPVLFIELDDDNLRAQGSSARELIDFLVSAGYNNFLRANTRAPVTPETAFQHCHFDLIAR